MSRFAEQCNQNLEMWRGRIEDIQFSPSEQNSIVNALSSNTCRSPEDFLNAFPPTLPEYLLSVADDSSIWSPISTPSLEKFSSVCKIPFLQPSTKISTVLNPAQPLSSTGSSTPPISPTESAGSSSFLSPRSDVFSLNAPLHATNGSAVPITEASLAVRAAYQAGGRKKYNTRRTSWNPDRDSSAFVPNGELAAFNFGLKGQWRGDWWHDSSLHDHEWRYNQSFPCAIWFTLDYPTSFYSKLYPISCFIYVIVCYVPFWTAANALVLFLPVLVGWRSKHSCTFKCHDGWK